MVIKSFIKMLYYFFAPHMKEKIADGLSVPLSECISENEIEW